MLPETSPCSPGLVRERSEIGMTRHLTMPVDDRVATLSNVNYFCA